MQYNNEALEEIIKENSSETKVSRTMAYRRQARHKAICRKKNLKKAISGCTDEELKEISPLKFDGMYSKGHINCTCGMCKPSKFKGRKSMKTISAKKFADKEIKEYLDNPGSFVAAPDISELLKDIPEKYRDEFKEMIVA